MTELDVGRLLEKNLYHTTDLSLIHRALAAVYIYETARQFKANQDLLSDSQWETVVELNGVIFETAKRPKREFKRA